MNWVSVVMLAQVSCQSNMNWVSPEMLAQVSCQSMIWTEWVRVIWTECPNVSTSKLWTESNMNRVIWVSVLAQVSCQSNMNRVSPEMLAQVSCQSNMNWVSTEMCTSKLSE